MGNRDESYRRDRTRQGKSEDKINLILAEVQRKLQDSYLPEVLKDLNSFERKQIHRFFDNKEDFETKTYRINGDYVLKIYPIGRIRALARNKAEEVMSTHNPIALPAMGSYERYIIHDALKGFDQVETKSCGEGIERHVEIHPVKFGRSLKKIMKKIKLI